MEQDSSTFKILTGKIQKKDILNVYTPSYETFEIKITCLSYLLSYETFYSFYNTAPYRI